MFRIPRYVSSDASAGGTQAVWLKPAAARAVPLAPLFRPPVKVLERTQFVLLPSPFIFTHAVSAFSAAARPALCRLRSVTVPLNLELPIPPAAWQLLQSAVLMEVTAVPARSTGI